MPWTKRCLDLLVCSAALVVAAPVMLVAAALIKLASPGPVLYVAPRAGWRGRPFGQLKFRTMHVGADRDGVFTTRNDRRVFPLGRLLRLFKIDELPQLWNVLCGEMSVVGPRPEEISIVRECYTAVQRQVLEAVPGLTGLPQIRFFPELSVIDPGDLEPQEHYRRRILPMRLEMDLEYVRRSSFWLDVRIIARTGWLIAFHSWKVLLFGMPKQSLPVAGLGEVR